MPEIGGALFCQRMLPFLLQALRLWQTDRARYSVCSNRPHLRRLRSTAMRHNSRINELRWIPPSWRRPRLLAVTYYNTVIVTVFATGRHIACKCLHVSSTSLLQYDRRILHRCPFDHSVNLFTQNSFSLSTWFRFVNQSSSALGASYTNNQAFLVSTFTISTARSNSLRHITVGASKLTFLPYRYTYRYLLSYLRLKSRQWMQTSLSFSKPWQNSTFSQKVSSASG